ncbi:MAG: tRNA (adenosine(37)-N6)-threonylcarbamoyltransferase complex transferase subunit TsaD [Rhodospirillaceae bacterium]|jgi:N6-L-threonylcarbamoyladenine synthase|nr:tRNA (adenosine(37)-N6)-threonylcarbamoyltransferase complex transferase subunit TsaD [Rhodospirillaceae bacterium]MBT5244510.1 tRNA (adenosine(37)-N6)-threonylcarbamoyltransferase complex transferase subunit TsaD [Rhodospirillaceae bacterium]MBT5560767.1 tRNA (adenosine(37)-N6)-threonylcarbamoyltransferase complex transferase subunit TsaD [Rhodospirillaceae bacterium]MBT6241606.1 tRNA (adenosine(37)-N6)-threonylcarbamoyltransferase complex transferase subunit TsaD [Rhodospirillaceae bacteriu
MIVLGIETSCDETAAAVVTDSGEILAETVLSQLEEHRPYGGVVPEVAARAHLEHIDRLVAETMSKAGTGFDQLDAVAATGGPGLIGGVIVGVMTAKAIAVARKLPFIAINHLEGHALSARLEAKNKIDFPYLLLLVSGGHCQLLSVEGPGRYKRLGTTIDDALGEAFDKTAKMLGLGYPGGPAVEAAAKSGDAARFDLPRPMKGRPGCDFSFSGLKTAVRHVALGLPEGAFERQDIADLCAGFQAAAGDVLADRTDHALNNFLEDHQTCHALVVAGGVAANQSIRQRLQKLADARAIPLVAPPPSLCTDNAAMIAWAAIERITVSGLNAAEDGLDFRPRPRWPLDPDAPSAAFAGAKA